MATGASVLVGRETERERLRGALEEASLGQGSLVLLAGEAGVGKTSIAEDLVAGSSVPALWGRASQSGQAPYGPIVAAFRSHLRSNPDGLADLGPLRPHMAVLLPELGAPARTTDRGTLLEAIRCALAQLAGTGHLLVILDDLQWSDEATVELMAGLAEPIGEMPVLVIAAYRSDGLPRDHRIRRLRHELRRGGHLHELTLAPLEPEDTRILLTEILEGPPAPSLARAIQDRTHGVPFFVEELARALLITESVRQGELGLELVETEVPVPDTIRDAVLIGASELSEEGRAAAEAASVAGEAFDLDLLGEISSAAGVGELVERELIVETAPGRAAFRHALAREALYADVPWLRRRRLHRRVAEALEAGGGRAIEVATHWLGSREEERAREALLRAAAESRAVHAHRDAVRAGRQALDLWPEGEDPDRRIEALEAYASSAELSAELAEATRAWREICAIRASSGTPEALAGAQRRLASLFDLRADRRSALTAREAAADGYAAAGLPAEAATERLAMGNYHRGSAGYSAAIELAEAARADAIDAKRPDLQARALGLEGVARAKRGDFGGGLETVQAGLALALEHDLTAVVAELYQRLSLVLYDSADYRRAETTLDHALDLCRADGERATEVACVTCMVYVLRERGEWARALEIGRGLISEGTAVWVAEGLIGVIYAFQGKLSSGRRLISSGLATASQVGHYNMTVDGETGLAWVAAAQGADEEAAELCRSLLARWESSEDHHYAIRGMRWATSFSARRGDLTAAHRCADALSRIAADTGHADALAALAHAIAEIALAEGDAATAAEQLARAVELHRGLDIPYERAEIELRAGVALGAAGERETALERLGDAYRSARKLGARPLAAEAAREVAVLGESVGRRLGSRASTDVERAGLTRRELEVMRHVAVGRTNREIAQELFLSPRTVDMHVRNILRKLDCRSRVEAARRAGELELLGG